MDPSDLLRVYDSSLREEGELQHALSVRRYGPLWWAEYAHGGFVTYRDLGGLEGDDLDALVAATVAHFRGATRQSRAEWKTRGHDAPADLGERLEAHGFVPEEVETVMLGEARRLAEAPVPDGVVVRQVVEREDLARMLAAQEAVFGNGAGPTLDEATVQARAGEREFWVAEADGEVVGAGSSVAVPGTGVVGIWGGGVLEGWRGRGVYRALVAARARSALVHGYELLHSDCTAMSRPILERSGLVAVTTTTPYVWTRGG